MENEHLVINGLDEIESKKKNYKKVYLKYIIILSIFIILFFNCISYNIFF